MTCAEMSNAFHVAMAKAFAARAPKVRLAYFDLANFYRDQLGRRFRTQPSSEILDCSPSSREQTAQYR